jgi:hypothetical protein
MGERQCEAVIQTLRRSRIVRLFPNEIGYNGLSFEKNAQGACLENALKTHRTYAKSFILPVTKARSSLSKVQICEYECFRSFASK